MTAPSTASRLLVAAICVSAASGPAFAAPPTPTFLVNPGVYTAVGSSEFSDFGDFSVSRLFDDNRDSEWAIDGYLGNNPQGRDEAWASIALDQAYFISHVRLAPRRPTGGVDGIDKAHLWLSATPFNVDVKSAAATAAFLATPQGQNPNLSVGPFPTLDEVDYGLASVLPARYLLARFVNASDGDSNRNLSVATLEAGVIGVVPEPSPLVLAAISLLVVRHRRT